MSSSNLLVKELIVITKRKFGGAEFTAAKIPEILVFLIQYMAIHYQEARGVSKKRVVVMVLQELCPDDTLDLLIPPLIDIMIDVYRNRIMLLPKECCEKCCTIL